MLSRDLKLCGSKEGTVIIGFVLLIVGCFFIWASGATFKWPVSGLLPM